MTPAEELRAAAVKLREMAGNASYETSDRLSTWEYDDGHVWDERGVVVISTDAGPEGAWIALMGPDKADLIAVWLESSAKTAEALCATWQHNPLELTDPHALAFARSVLGGVS